jgi:hypothetical protein
MSHHLPFDEILNAAIDELRDGQSLGGVLERYPQHAGALQPLLQAALTATAAADAGYISPSPRLQQNYTRVDAAVGRARWEASRSPQPSSTATPRPWYGRRLAFASLSLPVGIFALAVLGAGGAAAATVATTTGASDRISQLVEQVTPAWSHAVIPGGADHDAPSMVAVPSSTTEPAPTETSPIAPTDVATVTSAPGVVAATATTENGPQPIAATGVISNVAGNTFELLAGGITYKVQTDANTAITGEIAEGSTAEVAGELTGNDRLHATSVAISESPSGAPPESAPETPGGAPETPPGQADKTNSTGQPEKTKTPGPPAEPPSQGGAGGGGGNGNAGGNGEDENGSGNGNGGSN